ncbi:hypothetical protein V2J52_02800 [Georgenia sp. MJ173]|uniref:hypothetical protein n=1 Tax=Georgenia sunbinii TaxID=3117728 RepID=UPI002F25F456
MSQPPLVPAHLHGKVAIVARCPYCGLSHEHARRPCDDACQSVAGSTVCSCIAGSPSDGFYRPPCDPSAPGYSLVILQPTTPETFFRAAADLLKLDWLPESYEDVYRAIDNVPTADRDAITERALSNTCAALRRATTQK